MSRTQSDRKQLRSPPLGGSVFDRQSKRICFSAQMKTVLYPLTTMYQERWANAVGLPRLKLCQLSGSNVFLINCVAEWLNASWLDVLRDTNQPKKMILRHFKEEFIIKNSVNGGALLSSWKLRDDAIRVG
ncbi:hypothetical protein OUZ56_007385 [Daphnia magna]|uniref:Uncharacterized protein n=1 Tax=Daphnia magna TaxID=35525 RepID=A0ABR0A9T2_9CRUS|nr:hypothetical protein OUZ56_007385 [Daphnia magna]